jgi:hypothetical protein
LAGSLEEQGRDKRAIDIHLYCKNEKELPLSVVFSTRDTPSAAQLAAQYSHNFRH